MSHQETSVWNNYSWTPKEIENESEPPLPAGRFNLPLVFEDELDRDDYFYDVTDSDDEDVDELYSGGFSEE